VKKDNGRAIDHVASQHSVRILCFRPRPYTINFRNNSCCIFGTEVCQRILPPEPQFGKRIFVAEGDETEYYAEYSCRLGYELVGPQTISCADTAIRTSFPIPSCHLGYGSQVKVGLLTFLFYVFSGV
jgi:hypothetical protein